MFENHVREFRFFSVIWNIEDPCTLSHNIPCTIMGTCITAQGKTHQSPIYVGKTAGNVRRWVLLGFCIRAVNTVVTSFLLCVHKVTFSLWDFIFLPAKVRRATQFIFYQQIALLLRNGLCDCHAICSFRML